MATLETRKITVHGVAHPALDHHWVKDTSFLPFSFVGVSATEEEAEEWLVATDLLLTDLQSLLSESCHVFWSHLIFDDTLRASLDSFLKLMPRNFDGRILEAALCSQLEKLYTTYFKIFIRMTTCKESSSDYFTPHVFGTILYENYILDLPKIIDMCVLFGPTNSELLKKMIGNVFKHQPKYLEDVYIAVPSIAKLFEELIEKLTDNKLTVPRELSAPNPETSTSDVDMVDMCLYSSDMCHSLSSFLHSYPPASIPFHDASFYRVLTTFYEDVLTRLTTQLESSNIREAEELKAYERLRLAQEDCVSLFRHILITSTLEEASSNSEKSDSLVQQFYDILTEYLGDVSFMGHYSSLHPFPVDVDHIAKISQQSDHTREQFILDGLAHAQALREEKEIQNLSSGTESVQTPSENESRMPSAEGAAALPEPAAAVEHTLPSPIQSILDMFPEYGKGFIEMCLDHYKSVDLVINGLLEESLPSSLSTLDRTLEEPLRDETVVTSRRNVFDNDEFDVFRKGKIDTKKVHRGKRQNILGPEDSSYKDKIKELVVNCEDLSLSDGTANSSMSFLLDENLYDDEYDDTYDANEVGADDADEALELMGRKLVVPVALGGSGLAEGSEENAENPKPHAAYSKPKYDVKGRGKGQGQTAEVVRNRNFKTAHKARGANHNRKAGARSKMSKGMF